MKSNSIFNLTNPSGSTRNYRTQTGSTGSHTCLGDVGYIRGSASAMMALVLEGHSSTEPWQIVNIVDNQNVFLGSAAVLGATSDEHAINMALRTFNGYFDGVGTANRYDVVVDLVQKAIEYAKQNESHYLLPEAAEVIKQAVLSNMA